MNHSEQAKPECSEPEPLVPPEVDLRDFPYMPVDIGRLFGSEFHAHSDDTGWRAGFTLWLKSYHQVPASSIPDDDVALARLAELGRDVKTWRKIKASALRGWIKCSDGRLYHPVVAEKALEGWLEKLNQRKASQAGNAKRYGHAFDPSEIDALIEDCRSRLSALNPQSRILAKRLPKAALGTPDMLPPGAHGPPGGTPEDLPPGSQEKGREGKKESQAARATEDPGQGRPEPPSADPNRVTELDRVEAVCREALGDKAPLDLVIGPMALIVRDGIPLDRVAIILRSEARRPRQKPIRTWGIWAKIVLEKHADGSAPASSDKPAHPPDDSPRLQFPGGFSATENSLITCQRRGLWADEWGPKPGKPGCLVPERLWVTEAQIH